MSHNLPLKKCRPFITRDTIALSSVQNSTMEKSLLGYYRNISLCGLECCQRKNCNLVIYNGNLCYGAFCSAESECHFQSAKGDQASFQVVLSNEGKVT